jgi:hypothetical protein
VKALKKWSSEGEGEGDTPEETGSISRGYLGAMKKYGGVDV